MNLKIITRPMSIDDVDTVWMIESLCFSTPWSRKAFISEIDENACARYIVAERDGEVIGYGGMWLIVGEAHITNIAVHPSCRRQGVGRALVEALMHAAYEELEIREMTLEVRLGNTPAQEMYKSFGFTIEGRRKQYYEDNKEDALIMWCRDTTPFFEPILRRNMI